MDLQSYPQPESGKLEQIVSQFLLKILHVILDSRIPSLHERSGDLSSVSRVRRSDKWFNLVLGDCPAVLDNLYFRHRGPMDPMIIDIILVHHNTETVIERWIVEYESMRPPPSAEPASSSSSYKKTYKKSIILLRSLYSHMRLLPAYRVFRQLSSSTQVSNFDIDYEVSISADPFSRVEEATMKEYVFGPVEAFPGRLSVSVTYRPALSDFILELTSTDPLRSFPSSVPFRGIRPYVQRPRNWRNSGFHKGPPIPRNQNQPFNFASSTTNNDEYASLSPPTPMHTGLHPDTTASVSIPLPAPSTSSTPIASNFLIFSLNLSDPNRHSLPPLSPRSTKHDPSAHDSSSGNRFYRRAVELHSTAVNHYSGHKMIKDSKDDSGQFSGLLSSNGFPRIGFSRRFRRSSLHDDLDDYDFLCPFDVDDVDASDPPSSLHSISTATDTLPSWPDLRTNVNNPTTM